MNTTCFFSIHLHVQQKKYQKQKISPEEKMVFIEDVATLIKSKIDEYLCCQMGRHLQLKS